MTSNIPGSGRPRGRPFMPPGARADALVQLRVTPARLARWRRMAGPRGLSQWMTKTLDKAVPKEAQGGAE